MTVLKMAHQKTAHLENDPKMVLKMLISITDVASSCNTSPIWTEYDFKTSVEIPISSDIVSDLSLNLRNESVFMTGCMISTPKCTMHLVLRLNLVL